MHKCPSVMSSTCQRRNHHHHPCTLISLKLPTTAIISYDTQLLTFFLSPPIHLLLLLPVSKFHSLLERPCLSYICSLLYVADTIGNRIMDVCRSLGSLFDEPHPEKPTLMESLSAWNQIMPKEAVDPSAFTEIFGEFHHQETSERKASLESLLGRLPQIQNQQGREARCSHGFLGRNSDPLQLCTEGLGSESSDDVDDLMADGDSSWSSGSCHDDWKGKTDVENELLLHGTDVRSERCSGVRPKAGGRGRGFPPPISSIGRSGKPWICFRSYRQDGRFVLREFMIPTKEFLHASREDGRLKLHLIQPHDGIPEEEQQQQEEEEQMESNSSE